MKEIKLVSVICACGWHGMLRSCADCPNCSAPAANRVTPTRLAVLQAFQRGDRPRLQAITRNWLRDRKLLSARPPIEQSGKLRARRPRREWQVTDLGARVIVIATATQSERRGENEVLP